jgi:hypothetical protein
VSSLRRPPDKVAGVAAAVVSGEVLLRLVRALRLQQQELKALLRWT